MLLIVAFFLVWWSSGCIFGEEKGGNASGGLGSLLEVIPGRLHSKGGTAAKSSHFEEVVQGWPLNACSSFSIAAGSRSQMPLLIPPFFLNQLSLVAKRF
ncbi:hypothetical protein EDM58_08850 [Brevibacillus panacihumi]|uniref:Uncharacterized protein n=1 Tax=Brevibacillus panacihumi TaxID=497735 RepID=A0A3M8CZQ2_9BACL|nr:hypothetical protein EDM58_08850 [Brevibacillus panacihumi]